MQYKLGRNPSPQPPRLRFDDYLREVELPPVPPTFGHYSLFYPRGEWGMLDNNKIGNCTVAGAMHCCMLWNKIANKNIWFSPTDAIDDYSAITGYDPNDPSSDKGADIVQVADYWRKTGFRDMNVKRHKIAAYLHVDYTNLAHVDAACYLFGAVGFGVLVGEAEGSEFENGLPWVTPGLNSNGGHYVPMVGKDANYRKVVTWGGLQDVGEDWLRSQLDEVVAMVSEEALTNGRSAEGFDMAALQDDLKALGAA